MNIEHIDQLLVQLKRQRTILKELRQGTSAKYMQLAEETILQLAAEIDALNERQRRANAWNVPPGALGH